MNILGLNYFFHDSTACIVSDGQLLFTVEEERFTRSKHTGEFPLNAIDVCLNESGLRYTDIDHIAVSIQPTKDWEKKFLYGLKHITKSKPFISHEIIRAYYKQKKLHHWYQSTWKNQPGKPELHFVPHHMSHAAGTFLVSPFKEAAIMSMDGSGEWSTSFLGHGDMTEITEYSESYFPMSMGSFYEAATEFCGFKPNYDEGKTMGLAPMGNADRFYDEVARIIHIDEKGRIEIDLSYFNYQFWDSKRCSKKFYKVFGSPRDPKGEFEVHHMDVAAAFQKVLEDRALEMCEILLQRSGSKNLVISGGVSLNSVMNGRILRETKFEDIYVMPAAGDNGTAIGAAYYVNNIVLGNERNYVHNDPYLGNEYSNDEIEKILKQCKLSYEYHEDITDVAAKLLNDGKIIGWHQGRMEIGPRALGNRSILASPVFPNMKSKINAEVKHREAYRPFAPSTTLENKARYFEDLGDNPFMLKVCDVLPEYRELIPAVTHVDGTARLQTVRKEINPRYHELITKFGELSNVPVVLNTSFNIMGEPVVESPLHAIRCFFSTGLDALVIGNFLIKK